MEEEKKEIEQPTSEPIQAVATPTVPEVTPEVAPAEPIVINTEEPKVETVESLEPEKIESLNDDEPIESLDEPVESLDGGEVIIEGQEAAPTPEAAPAPAEVPVVPKATENPVLENPPKEEEKKPEPPKEEVKKEEKKPEENAKDKKMLIVVIVGGIVLVGLIINMIVNGGLFGGNAEEEDEDEDEEVTTPTTPTNNQFDLSKAGDVMKPFELYDTCGNSFIVSLSKLDTFTATINDLDKAKITSIILSQFEAGTDEITYEQFQSKAKSLFEFEGDFVPSNEASKVSADGTTCEAYTYSEADKKFTNTKSSNCTSACGPLKKYEYIYKVTEGVKQDGLVTITYKVLFGDISNEDNIKNEGLKLYSDSAKSNLVNTYPNKATDGGYDFGIIATGDYDKGTTVKFIFKEDGGKYTFVKSEVSK